MVISACLWHSRQTSYRFVLSQENPLLSFSTYCICHNMGRYSCHNTVKTTRLKTLCCDCTSTTTQRAHVLLLIGSLGTEVGRPPSLRSSYSPIDRSHTCCGDGINMGLKNPVRHCMYVLLLDKSGDLWELQYNINSGARSHSCKHNSQLSLPNKRHCNKSPAYLLCS